MLRIVFLVLLSLTCSIGLECRYCKNETCGDDAPKISCEEQNKTLPFNYRLSTTVIDDNSTNVCVELLYVISGNVTFPVMQCLPYTKTLCQTINSTLPSEVFLQGCVLEVHTIGNPPDTSTSSTNDFSADSTTKLVTEPPKTSSTELATNPSTESQTTLQTETTVVTTTEVTSTTEDNGGSVVMVLSTIVLSVFFIVHFVIMY